MSDRENGVKTTRGKKGCLPFFIVAVLLFTAIGFFMDDDAPLSKDNPSSQAVTHNGPSPESAQKISQALASASVTRNTAQHYKLTYDILLPVDTVFTLSANEASELMQTYVRAQNECSKFDRTFIGIYAQGYDTGFASLSYEAKTKKISVMNSQWDGYLCGVKTLQNNPSVIYEKIKKYRAEAVLLAVEFAKAYGDTKDSTDIMAEGDRISEEWESFLSENYIGQCYPVFPVQYDNAATKTSSLLLSIRASETIFDLDSFKREINDLSLIKL